MAREADPQTQIQALARELAQAPALPRAILLRGAEAWFRERALEHVLERARALGLEVAAHDGVDRDFVLQSLISDLCSPAMFAPARCIVLRNPEALLKKLARSEDPPATRAILAFLARKDGAGALVIAADSLRADHAVSKALAQAGGVTVACRKLWDSPPPWERDPDPRKSELAQWLVARARERGRKLDPGAAVLLIAASGNDLYALDAQLDRLGEKGGAALLANLESDAAGSPWKIADEIARGDAAGALFGLETLFQNGMRDDDGVRVSERAALMAILLPAVRRNLRHALAGALAVESGASAEAAADEIGVPAGEPARRAFRAALGARGPREQAAMQAELAELERRSRTGARIDENDLALFAARWRARPRGAR